MSSGCLFYFLLCHPVFITLSFSFSIPPLFHHRRAGVHRCLYTAGGAGAGSNRWTRRLGSDRWTRRGEKCVQVIKCAEGWKLLWAQANTHKPGTWVVDRNNVVTFQAADCSAAAVLTLGEPRWLLEHAHTGQSIPISTEPNNKCINSSFLMLWSWWCKPDRYV